MEGLFDKMGPAVQTLAAYASFLIASLKKFLSLFRFATGIDIIPDETKPSAEG